MSVSIVQGDLAALTVHLEKAAVPVAAAAPTAADASASAPAVPAAAPSIPDIPRSLDVLRAMLALPRVTADELRVTSAGKLVQRLSKSGEAAIAALAKELLAKWKAQVLPPPPSGPTGVEKAKQEAAAAAQKALAEARAAAAKKKAEAEAAAAAAAAKKSEASGDSDSDADGKKSKKDKKRRDKEESAKKRSKTDEDSARASPPASAVSKLVAASKNEKSLATQHPHLTAGPYALFATNDDLRDKMQLMFWQAIGEPSADVIAQTAAATGDLNAYKPAHAHKKHDESKSAGTPSMAPSPSPSPPPIANIALSSPSADAAAPASATPSSAAPASASAATASTSAPSAPVFRSRIELAFLIEQAMFNKLGPSSSTAYRQKYRDLAPQLKDPSNADLNADLFLNRITPDEVINMTAHQLAPSSMKEKRAKEAKWAREAARSDLTIGDGATDAFLCEACAEAGRPGRRCVFFQQQTRGADEPMTIFVTCLDCGNKFRSGDGER